MAEKNDNKTTVGAVINEINETLEQARIESIADIWVCNNYISQDEGLSEEEKVEKINEYMSLHCELDKFLYLSGSTLLKCEWGTIGANCTPGNHNIKIDNNPAISSTDCKVGEHMQCFAVCLGQTKKEGTVVKCEPKIAHEQWMNYCANIAIGDAYAVNENSYLICTRCEGGIIRPIPMSGKTEDDIEVHIESLISQINGNCITRYEEMCMLPTVEILARMIYQENHHIGDEQNRIVFSVVNRLCFQDGYLSKDKMGNAKVNNIYGIVTSGGQFQSIFDENDAAEKTANNQYNAYWVPSDENANLKEKESWENAMRLAALLYYSVELYGDGEDTDKGKCVGKDNPMEVRENIINFLESQTDTQGNKIENTIGEGTYFRAGSGGKNVFH